EKPVEIRVAQGTYKPSQGLVAIPEFDWREATFQLINDVTLKGGYAGSIAPDPNARDAVSYETILSGDLNNDDVVVNDTILLDSEPTRSENSYHVVTAVDTDESPGLDGFTVTGGKADQWSIYEGGGLLIKRASPAIVDCKFAHCSALDGGAIHCTESRAELVDCTFSNNLALVGAGILSRSSDLTVKGCVFENNVQSRFGFGWFDIYWAAGGGGIRNESGNPTLVDCLFIGNSAEQGGGLSTLKGDPVLLNCTFIGNSAHFGAMPSLSLGGALRNTSGNPTLNNCTFTGNRSGWSGGGMHTEGNSYPILHNCLFSGNRSAHFGGGICQYGGGGTKLTGCTFVQNLAPDGNALTCDSKEQEHPGSAEFADCIVWDGVNEMANNDDSAIVVTYSNVEGGHTGEGNIDADPLFADPGYWAYMEDPNIVVEPNDPNAVWVDGDYHLKSATGRWDPNIGTWIRDDVTSPCIDAGDPDSDRSDEVWPHGGRINMGAYGGTQHASLSAEPQGMSLPRVAYVYHNKIDVAEGYQALLVAHGCPTTLIASDQVVTTKFDDYDLIIAGTDTGYSYVWADEQNVTAVEGSGKPVVGQGKGGYWYFGYLGLTIGRPNGGSGFGTAIEPVDPDNLLFSKPYLIEIPQDGVLELSTEADAVILYLYPAAPDTVTTLGQEAGNIGYYSLALEQNRYLFWGFTGPAESLTEAGRKLLVNAVIRTANAAWATDAN
ncbi:MAG: right-handed parallel beta-helix repeat-containing protein, partial [Candidatus Zixiibacteriota bacterium]